MIIKERTNPATSSTEEALYRSNGSYSHPERQKNAKYEKIVQIVNAGVKGSEKWEDLVEQKDASKRIHSNQNSPKLNLQQCSNLEIKADPAATPLIITRPPSKRARLNRRATEACESANQQKIKSNPSEGGFTSRSIVHQHSLSKLNSNYMEENMREQEEMLKKIEEKAIILKRKWKKQREILKQIKKKNEVLNQTQPNTYSIEILPQNTPKIGHRRGESHDCAIQEDKEYQESYLASLERVNSQQDENNSLLQSVKQKENEIKSISEQFAEVQSKFEILQGIVEELRQQQSSKELQNEKLRNIIAQCEKKIEKLEGKNKESISSLLEYGDLVTKLQNKNTALKQSHKNQISQLEKSNKSKIESEQLIIAQLNLTITNQTIKLQEIQMKNAKLEQIYNQEAEQHRQKSQQHLQSRRSIEKQISQLAQDKRKQQQYYLKEIQNLKSQAQLLTSSQKSQQKQHNEEIEQLKLKIKFLNDQIKRKEEEIHSKVKIHEESHNKTRLQFDNTFKPMKEELNKQNLEITKLNTLNDEKLKEIATMNSYLKNAEEHINKIQAKYHSASKQLTQKNLSFDFLWIQLREEEQKRAALQDQIAHLKQTLDHHSIELQKSLLHSENDSPIKQEGEGQRSLKHVLSSSTLKDMKDLKGMIEQGENRRDGRESLELKQSKVNCLPMSHQNQLFNFENILTSSKAISMHLQDLQQVEQAKDSNIQDKQLEIDILSPANPNIILQNDISQAFSESQQNDEINEMISNNNSNNSRRQSSIGAFSQYSRIKSTKSQMTHKQIEDTYRDKMKNSKYLAKMSKFKNRK